MQGITHILVGIVLGLASLSFSLSPLQQILVFSFAVLGSLLPDIDVATSFLGRRVKLIGYIFSHRGFFHSLFFLILISIIFSELFFFLAGVALFFGMLSHLFLDMMTKEGLRLFFLRKEIKGFIRVGSLLEKGIQILLVLLIVIIIV